MLRCAPLEYVTLLEGGEGASHTWILSKGVDSGQLRRGR